MSSLLSELSYYRFEHSCVPSGEGWVFHITMKMYK